MIITSILRLSPSAARGKHWMMYMLDAVEKTSLMTTIIINQIVKQMEVTLEHGRKHIKWYNKEVNKALFSQPYSRPKVIGSGLSKSSRTTLTKYMEELARARILTPKKAGKVIYYLKDDLIRILEG